MNLIEKMMAAAVAISAVSSAAAAPAIDDREVMAQLNSARSDPLGYAQGLQQYRSYFHANLLHYPQLDEDIVTDEGIVVVDETIAYLRRQPALGKVRPSSLLRAAAAEHLADQQDSGAVGHAGSDGFSPGRRVKRLGGGEYVAEIISYGSIDPVDAMRQLIVDDGVADRGHRSIVYDGELRYAGAACGSHPIYRTMCVVVLAITPDGREPQDELRYASR